VFAKLKSDVRKASPREHESLIRAVAASVRSFTARQCNNFFAHAHYATN
ncbi:hypothetical protein M2103_001713, partial [Ereboglobus sp. PH5-5]|nr:hypothetical protein [Ereboglobus sp. PH5-5]MDF9833489.1 hypothetical protein [Ereboglobus sp. PH5-5]